MRDFQRPTPTAPARPKPTAADLMCDDERSRLAWAANASDVAADPTAATTTNLRRAIHFLDHARVRLIHRAEKEGRTVYPDTLAGYLNEISWYQRILAARERLELVARAHPRDHRRPKDATQ